MSKKFKWFMIIFIVFGAMNVVLNMISSPLIDKYFISIFEFAGPDFWSYAIGAFGLILFWSFIAWPPYIIHSFWYNYFQPRHTQEMRELLLAHIYGNDYQFFLDKNIGSIQNQISKIQNNFYSICSDTARQLIGIVIGFAFLVGMMFRLDITIMAIIGAWGIIRLVWVIFYSKKTARNQKKISELQSRNWGAMSDSILNFMNVKIFSNAPHEQEYLRKERYELINTTWKNFKFRWFNSNGIDFINALTGVAVMWLLVLRFANGGMIASNAVFIIGAFWTLSRNFGKLGEIYNGLIENYADAKQAWTEIIVPRAIKDKSNARNLKVSRGAVELRDISFKYNAGWVVHDLSLKIKAGERVGIVGLSGAGKTTLSHLLLRFFDVQRGGIYIDNQNIKDVRQDSLREQIAFVPQDPVLFNRTIGENIGYARHDASRDEIIRAAKLANIHDFIMSTKGGYDTVVGNRGIKLSGGQRQRIAIARAILKNSKILILDEATSSLDSETEAVIQKSFESLMKNRTTIAIAHRLSTLRKMDRIVVMQNGTIAEQGTHAQLLRKKNGIYARLWEMQSGGFV